MEKSPPDLCQKIHQEANNLKNAFFDRKRSSLNKSLPRIERSISPLMKYKKPRYGVAENDGG